MRRNFTSLFKFLVLCVVTVLLTVFLYKTFFLIQTMYDENDNVASFKDHLRAELHDHPRQGAFFNAPRNSKGTKIDWHDYRFMEIERKRNGPGEHGAPAHTQPDEEEERKRLFALNGFNGYLSDKISINRSIADIRHKE